MATPKRNYVKICLNCKKEFKGLHNNIYCSPECRNSYYKQKGCFSHNTKISATVIGTISELVVVNDLLSKGFEVYRPLTPDCSGDLMIEKNNVITKIEVRTCYKTMSNKIQCTFKNIRSPILAQVLLFDNSVKYIDTIDNHIIDLQCVNLGGFKGRKSIIKTKEVIDPQKEINS